MDYNWKYYWKIKIVLKETYPLLNDRQKELCISKMIRIKKSTYSSQDGVIKQTNLSMLKELKKMDLDNRFKNIFKLLENEELEEFWQFAIKGRFGAKENSITSKILKSYWNASWSAKAYVGEMDYCVLAMIRLLEKRPDYKGDLSIYATDRTLLCFCIRLNSIQKYYMTTDEKFKNLYRMMRLDEINKLLVIIDENMKNESIKEQEKFARLKRP